VIKKPTTQSHRQQLASNAEGSTSFPVDQLQSCAVFLATCRIGVSRLAVDVGSLGSHHSWGYGSTGKKSTGNMYTPYPANQVIDQATHTAPNHPIVAVCTTFCYW
jgi:hypothetical protein